MDIYDIIIVGGGPSGMTAGLYSARAGMKTLLIERAGLGGQLAITPNIENYPGALDTDGFILAQGMADQVKKAGVEIKVGNVTNFDLSNKIKTVVADNVEYHSYAVILAMGSYSIGLGVEGENKFLGKGVSYCAVCDGAFFKDKTVAVVGGGDMAITDATYLASLVKKVYIINRLPEFSLSTQNLDNLNKLIEAKKIEIIYSSSITKIQGDKIVDSIEIMNENTKNTSLLSIDAVFVAIGKNPNSELLQEVTLDNGYIVTNSMDMSTNISGVFACGDITKKFLRQVSTAVSDGAIAGSFASAYVKKILKSR